MGSLVLPSSGMVYVDSSVLIYTVEKHPTFGPLLAPFWDAVERRGLDACSGELSIMETLVLPIRTRNASLLSDYERFFLTPGLRWLPIGESILREAAAIRALTGKMQTPDAIHLSTALQYECALLLTNDLHFRGAPGLPIAILTDVISED